ncbi:unnamed protein product [Alopecurus aequalis]
MAASNGWGDDDPTAGEWPTLTRSGRSSHSGPAGRYPNTTPAALRHLAPTAGEVAKGFAGLEIDYGSRRLDEYDMPVEVSGEGAPAPVDGFEEAGLAEAVLRNVTRCGYDNPTPVQRYSMPIVLSGRDLMACAQPGSGKKAAFCLPMVSELVKAAEAGGPEGGGSRGDREAYDYDDYSRAARPRALVLAPTRELAAKIHEEAKEFSHQTGIRVKVAYGGTQNFQQQLSDIERGVDVLVATPGRLVHMIERGKVSLKAIKYLVLDEADRMLDMGFEPQIRKIVDEMGMPPKSVRQTMLFSATFPQQIQRLASDFLSKYIFITVGRVGSSTDQITQKVEFVTKDEKRTFLLDLLQKQSFCSSDGKPQQPLTLVFVETKRDADLLWSWLQKKGFPATAIHGDRTQEERKDALRSFKSGSTPIMVATVSRGLDVPNVSHVINYDLPKSIEDYVHRIGRTGRAGNAGSATAFFTEQNHPIAKGLLELMTEAKQKVPDWLEDYAGRLCYGGGLTYGGRGRGSSSDGSSFGGRYYRNSGDYSGYSDGCGDSYSGGGGGGGSYSGGGGGGGRSYSCWD